MFRLAGLVLLAACASSRDAGDEPSIADELDALIAKTNALESFHAVYRMQLSSGGATEPATMELVYEAPGRAVCAFESSEASARFRFGDGRILVHAPDESGAQVWKAGDVPNPSAGQALDERFPPLGGGLDPGVYFTVDWPRESDTDDGRLRLNTLLSTVRRTCLLAWLSDLRALEATLHREGRELAGAAGGARFWLSRESGFFERIEVQEESGDRTTMILDRLQLDEPVAEFLAVPEEALATEQDPAVSRMIMLAASAQLRALEFNRVGARLGDGRLTWNDEVREDWRAVIDAYHRERMPWRYASWNEELGQWSESWIGRVRSAAAADAAEALDDLRVEVEAAREQMLEGLSDAEQQYVDELHTAPEAGGLREPRPELLLVEEQVVHALFAELVRDPVVDDFDAQIAAAFESGSSR